MENKHSTKVVRLTRRDSLATHIVSPKAITKVPELALGLARSKYPTSTNIAQVTLASGVRRRGERVIDASHKFMTNENPSAYGFAFASGVMPKLASLFLIPMILVYPLYPAYAAEESVTQHASSTDATIPPVSDNKANGGDGGDTPKATTDNVTPPISVDPVATTTESTPSSSDALVLGAATTSEMFTASVTPATVPTSQGGSDEVASTSATSIPSSVSLGDATSTAITATSSVSQNNASSTDTTYASSRVQTERIQNAVSLAEATATEEATPEKVHTPTAEELAQVIIKQKEDSMRASIRKEVEGEFSKGCLTIDSIGYYCLKDPKGQSGSLTPSEVVTGVNAQVGEGSAYKQIFMTKGGASIALTHDLWDDAFPSIDVSGKSIVWQGNVNGRWQIFFANAATSSAPAVIALTHSNESNFNPRVDGNDVVWQGWVDGNWEIFLAEHLIPENYLAADKLSVENTHLGIDNTWKVTRITTNGVHDMFPSVSGGLVTWQSFQDNAWAVYAYSIKTGATTKLSSVGAKSENPRFAITWDERTPEGAAHMVGYDIASGKTIDLTNEARQVSDDNKPYQPQAPISQDNQAALPPPATTTATTSVMKGDGDDGSTGNGLGV